MANGLAFDYLSRAVYLVSMYIFVNNHFKPQL
jgi:hypothetical protein